MLGSFLEIALSTPDIRASYEYYAALGLEPATAGDIWNHPYGVMEAEGLALGLHGLQQASPAVVCVRENVAALARELGLRGVQLDHCRLGNEVFNELAFTDPSGLVVRVLEARTFSPAPAPPARTLPGRFLALSLPSRNLDEVAAFWRGLGYGVTDEEEPWRHLRFDAVLPLAWHGPRQFAEPLLLFQHGEPGAAQAALAAAGIEPRPGPAAVARWLLESPEQQALAILA
ncbi:MAG: hypothetical protein ABI859_10555 [Pseudomonadota bacterium]